MSIPADEAPRQAIADALARARRADKRVLVVFGADWCPDSSSFDEVREHPLMAPLLDLGFEVVDLDVGARDQTPIQIATLVHRWLPDRIIQVPASNK